MVRLVRTTRLSEALILLRSSGTLRKKTKRFLGLRVAFLVRARLLFAEGGVSIAHLRLPRVVLRAVSQLGLERLRKKQTETGTKSKKKKKRRRKEDSSERKTRAIDTSNNRSRRTKSSGARDDGFQS